MRARHIGGVFLAVAIVVPAARVFGGPDAKPSSAVAGVNLDFERGKAGEFPFKWLGGGNGFEIATSTTKPHGGKQCGMIRWKDANAPAQDFAAFSQPISPKAFAGKRARLRAWLRSDGIDSGWAGLWFRVDGANNKVLSFDNMQARPVKGTTEWKQYEIVLEVPNEAKAMYAGALLSGNGALYADDFSIEVAGAKDKLTSTKTITAAPGLFELRGEFVMQPQGFLGGGKKQTATILIPLPLCYREQVPLTYELTIKPDAAAKSSKIIAQENGNYVLELKVAVPKKDEVEVRWRSVVLCGPRSFEAVPKKAMIPAKWPDEARPWLKSTRCVQCDDQHIRAMAKEIAGDSHDVMAIIAGVIERTRAIYAKQKGQCSELGAVEAIEKRGSCTSCANLVAALLRASGVPARILAGYPVWSGPLQTHYIVEAYVPEYGWYPIESTRLEAPWQPYQQMEVAVISPEMEEKSQQRFNAAGGVPYLSLTEYPEYAGGFLSIGSVDREKYCDHVATLMHGFGEEATAAEWDAAIKRSRTECAGWLNGQLFGKGGNLHTSPPSDRLDHVASLPELDKFMQEIHQLRHLDERGL